MARIRLPEYVNKNLDSRDAIIYTLFWAKNTAYNRMDKITKAYMNNDEEKQSVKDMEAYFNMKGLYDFLSDLFKRMDWEEKYIKYIKTYQPKGAYDRSDT